VEKIWGYKVEKINKMGLIMKLKNPTKINNKENELKN
jgi:hypothetical protein